MIGTMTTACWINYRVYYKVWSKRLSGDRYDGKSRLEPFPWSKKISRPLWGKKLKILFQPVPASLPRFPHDPIATEVLIHNIFRDRIKRTGEVRATGAQGNTEHSK